MKPWLKFGIPLAILALAVLAIVLFPSGGSGDGPPDVEYGKAACAHCRMVVSQPGFGAQIRRNGKWEVFDDLGCLLRTLDGAPIPANEIWVEDRGGNGFVRASDARFVRAPGSSTPMGSGLAAFAKSADADAFAREKKTVVIAFAELARENAAEAPFTELEANLGRTSFASECGACHGERGDGAGPAAAFLDPKPRDFTRRMFKLRTTESGKPPRPEDVLATIEHGMPGSSMPSFAFLPKEEKRKLGAYVFKAAGLLDKPAPEALPDPGTPPATDGALLARGAELWKQMGCGACHGPAGRGDGENAAQLKDSWGHPIRPRDLTSSPFRGGDAPRDIWYRLYAGIDGTPMPPFGDLVTDPRDRWALVAHVSSIRTPPAPASLPTDPIAAGRAIAERAGCRGCHVLDDGKGGEVGPSFGLIAQKLQPDWIEGFLDEPRAAGKIYPWRPHRMPDIALSLSEGEAMAGYFAALSKRAVMPAPELASFPADRLAEGKMTFVVKCAQCHALGETVKTPLASQQGPDLVHAPDRVRWDWTKEWILDPKKFDPKTKMTVPGISPQEAESVRMFIWKTADSEKPDRQHAAASEGSTAD